MGEIVTIENGIALLTLTVLEIVLGIDNIVFLTIVVGKLPDEQRANARQIGWCWRWACASCCCWRSDG